MSKRSAQADHKVSTGLTSERLSKTLQNQKQYIDETLDVSDSSTKDVDSTSLDRRKMQRRAANRRSAQLSRARKKVSEV
jgi:hypothetical protein